MRLLRGSSPLASSGRQPAALSALLLLALAAAPDPALAGTAPDAGDPACQHDIGVLAHRPKDLVLLTWQPLAQALERSIPGCRFRVEALTYAELEDAIAALLAALAVILGMAIGLVVVNRRLRAALASVKTLSGLLPICMYCHKIRTDQGYWDQLESFISARSEAAFSHGICPSCLDHRFPQAGAAGQPPPR